MRKIPTLFVRPLRTIGDTGPLYVEPEVTPGCEWVLAGQGSPSRKWDGTCFWLDPRGRWWARREVRAGKTPPPDFQPVQFDPNSGKTFGWEPAERSSFAAIHGDAVRALGTVARTGTYELVGPKVNGNPEGAPTHILIPHGLAVLRGLDGLVWPDAAAAYDDLGLFLQHAQAGTPEGSGTAFEGIVWAHPDGRRAKLKARDFAPASDVSEPASDGEVTPDADPAVAVPSPS